MGVLLLFVNDVPCHNLGHVTVGAPRNPTSMHSMPTMICSGVLKLLMELCTSQDLPYSARS